MTGEAPGIGEDDLHGWVDDQLSPARRSAVERWLERNPDDAARWRAYRLHRAGLRALLAPKADEPIPPALIPSVVASGAISGAISGATAPGRQDWRARLRVIAASLLLVLVGGGAGWILRGPTASGLAAEAVQAHLTFVGEVRHPVEVPANQEAHLVAWLSNRLGRPLRVPDLARFGFDLIGGRLLPTDALPAAQFMFENPAGVRLTLFVRPDPERGTGFDLVQREGVVGFRWFEGGFGYVILAPISRASLLQIAEAIYRQFPTAVSDRVDPPPDRK